MWMEIMNSKSIDAVGEQNKHQNQKGTYPQWTTNFLSNDVGKYYIKIKIELPGTHHPFRYPLHLKLGSRSSNNF